MTTTTPTPASTTASKTNKLGGSSSTQHDSVAAAATAAAAAAITAGASAATTAPPQFPTPLPPPAPPAVAGGGAAGAATCGVSRSSSVGIVLATKRSASSTFSMTRTRQQPASASLMWHSQQRQHTFGLPPSNPAAACYSSRADALKTDNTLRPHQLLVGNRKTSSTAAAVDAAAAAAAVYRFTDGNKAAGMQTAGGGNGNGKKKRCTDRYDSSESSDSGVATSLSCTDSSIASSEDASEPGSPYSPHSNLGEEQQQQQHQQQQQQLLTDRKMAPQTILAAASSTTTPATASNPSAVLNTASNNNNSTTPNTNKLKQQQTTRKPLPLNTCTNTANSKLPSLQKIGSQQPPNTQPIWPWSAAPASTTATSTTPAAIQSKKRNSTSTSDGAAKKSRASNGNPQSTSAIATAAPNASLATNASKRLKAAALEESQTKITGYFKSQMKAQQIQSKRPDPVPSSSSVSNSMTTNALTMSTPATTASLNKYFNILSQIKESNNQREQQQQQQQQQKAANTSNPAAPATTSSASSLTSSATVTSTPSTTSSTALPVPALKKIERSKPTKIAQVAPNLRKPYNSNSSSYAAPPTPLGKSPKKHVAIAPRTPDMKQNSSSTKEIAAKQQQPQQQQILPQPQQPAVLLTAIRVPTAPAGTQQQQQTVAAQQQHALGTAQAATLKQQQTAAATTIKVPANAANAAPANTTLFQLPVQLPNLVQLPQLLAAANGANIMQLSNAAAKATAQASAATTAQAAQAAAAQYFLNGTVFKLQQFTTATTTTATSAVATTGGPAATVNPFSFMHVNDLQELLLKQQQQQQLQLQQKNSAAAAVAAAATAANANFQEIFQQQIAAAVVASQQQQQQQQQFQQLQRLSAAANNLQQPVFMATPTGLLLNAASLPTMLAQAAAAVAANNSQQHQQKTIALQQQSQTLPALQPIQAAIPALSSIYGQHAAPAPQAAMDTSLQDLQNQQQQQQQQFQQQLALAQQQQQQQQQQFVTATQPPPLSVVSPNSATNAAGITTSPSAKLAIVKASPGQFSALSSQPPPLVTISSGSSSSTKPRAHVTATGGIQTKPSAMAKPYQKRSPKSSTAPAALKTLSPSQSSRTGKIVAAASKIVASPTTPPPLVPASSSSSSTLLAPLPPSVPTDTSQAAPSLSSQVKPAPALVSIAASNPPLTKLATSVVASMGSASTTCTSNLASSNLSQQTKPTITVAKDLFDFVKNSAPPLTITRPSSPAQANVFDKIKEEPLDEPQESTSTPVKPVPPTYAAGLPVDIKLELLEDGTKLSSTNPSAMQECSSSSFCSHSNSVSSSVDLSLEASTAASLTSSAPSPAPSTESAAAEPSSACDSNSNSCATTTAASLATSQDQLNDLSTMSSSTSPSLASLSQSSASDSCSLRLSLSASMNCKSNSEHAVDKRDVKTPESGLGGSLSNSETSSSHSLAGSSSLSSSSKAGSAEPEIATPLSRTSTTESPAESNSTDSQAFTAFPSEPSTPLDTPATVDTHLAEASGADLPKAAISPILSQPKTIRFPAASGVRQGPKGAKRHDGVCYWHKCNKKHDSSSKLLDHMQTHHVNSQTGPFACLWVGCKVYQKESCSRRWLERHVLSHGGSKQFKCIVEGCGLRFGSQLALQKHVNNHFTATESKESTNKRTSDPPVPKQLRKNGKKLRYRRQPFSARMFDFFDAGIMEGLQHRLRQISTLTNGRNCITFQGQSMMRRRTVKGVFECFVRWSPREIIADEWLPECGGPYIKTVNIKQMRPAEKTKIESLLMTAYRLPYAPNLFENDFSCGKFVTKANHNKSDGDEEESGRDDDEDENEDDEGDEDEDDDDDGGDGEEEEEEDNETSSIAETQTNESSSTISSYQQVLTIAKLQMQQQRKHPRKPQKRMPTARLQKQQ